MSVNSEKLLVFQANMDAAMRQHFDRTKMEMISDGPMPFDNLLMGEDDGCGDTEDELGDYEMRQRVAGARALLRFIKRDGLDMNTIMKQLFSVGRALHDDFFSSLTMTESALMFSETKAAHSWRCKLLSGALELAGMKGTKLPGQKSAEASESYRKAQKGNSNRRKKTRKKNRRVRQGSFLRKLKLNNKKQEQS